MKLIQIQANITWQCAQTPNRRWIGNCEPLGLTVQSERYSELAEDIGDALDLLFADLLQSNELDQFLSARGWRRSGKLPRQDAEVKFDVPFELLIADRNGSSASLR